MKKESQRASLSSDSANAWQNSKQIRLPIWLRLGVPTLLAVCAGFLNMKVVYQQIQPIEAYQLTRDVEPGTTLEQHHLEKVVVGGDISADILFSFSDLDQPTSGGVTKDLLSNGKPLIFSRRTHEGELLVKHCFGGVKPTADDERYLEVPASFVRPSTIEVYSGKIVFFDLIEKVDDHNPNIEEIGPYRMVIVEKKQKKDAPPEKFYRLEFKVDPSGTFPPHAKKLQKAAYASSRFELALIERPSKPLPNAVIASAE